MTSELGNLSPEQLALLDRWIPGASVERDHGWGLVETKGAGGLGRPGQPPGPGPRPVKSSGVRAAKALRIEAGVLS